MHLSSSQNGTTREPGGISKYIDGARLPQQIAPDSSGGGESHHRGEEQTVCHAVGVWTARFR